MRKNLFTRSVLVLLFLMDNFGVQGVSGSAPAPELKPGMEETRISAALTYAAMSIELSTPTHKVIEFDAGDSPEKTPASTAQEIPQLVLTRNGVLTPPYERTLDIVANNIPISAPGAFVMLTIFTQHQDPDYEGKNGRKVQVWQETRFIPQASQIPSGMRAHFQVTFDRDIQIGDKSTQTPTDYFQYQISIIDSTGVAQYSRTENYAFLMENQWRVPLPKLLEAEPDAAPDHLLVYYYDMIPFQADLKKRSTRISRQNVDRYIQTELIPAMVNAMQVQSNAWGFVWYPEWKNSRREEDAKTLSVALGERGIWFHGRAPSLGHSMISIRVDGSAGEYDSLTEGIMSVFHHELFHNLQRNIDLHFGNHGDVSGMDNAWMMFSEGTAVLASLVGQPQAQFNPESAYRSYMKRANAFIGFDGAVGGGLNKSYEEIPYHTAIYWRFLYEKCGGLKNGIEDPAIGMKVIRSILETLYSGKVVDIHASNHWTENLPRILDHVLAEADCPFHTYKASLSEFAHSIYLLRLANGRCGAIIHENCGFNDPYSLYNTPPVEHALMNAKPANFINGNIATSYGIDFIELTPDSNPNGQSFRIVFDTTSDSNADYLVQLVMLKSTTSKPILVKESSLLATANGEVVFETGGINLQEVDCLGLIIIRTDANEQQDANGSYTIQVLKQN